MLVLAVISLVGMSAAFPLCIGSAGLIGALFQLRTASPLWLAIGLALLICSVVLVILAIRIDKASVRAPAPKPGIRGPERKPSRGGKGIIVGVISGIVLGCFFPVVQRGISGDFGLGPYAGLLLIGIALLVSTLVLNLYFMNMAISGGPIGFNAYFTGLPR